MESLLGPDAMRHLRAVYLRERARYAEELEAAWLAADLEALGRAAHALRPGAARMGDEAVARLAQAVDDACQAGRLDDALGTTVGLLVRTARHRGDVLG